MNRYEHCCECNERTGRAGASDDSLYLGSVGPFCEDCVNTWPDKMTEEYSRLMARVVVLEAVTTKADECCTWEQDDADYAWSGDCGIYWSFEDGGPKDNCVKFCPNCGKPCVSIELEEEQDDE